MRWLHTDPYSQIPDPVALAALGLYWDGDLPDPDYALWPDNYAVFELYQMLLDYWLTMDGVRRDIDWSLVPHFMTLLNIRRKDWPVFFRELQLMKSTALDCWNAST